MTLADALFPQTLFPSSPTAWAAVLLLTLALMAARQWGFHGLIALAATLPGARPATETAHRQRFLRIDAERLALSAPALIGGVGETAAVLLDQPLMLAVAALTALPCMLGTARFCITMLGVPGLLPAAAAIAGGAGAFAAGVLLGALAPPLLLAREGRWTPHLLVQAPFLGARRLFGCD